MKVTRWDKLRCRLFGHLLEEPFAKHFPDARTLRHNHLPRNMRGVAMVFCRRCQSVVAVTLYDKPAKSPDLEAEREQPKETQDGHTRDLVLRKTR